MRFLNNRRGIITYTIDKSIKNDLSIYVQNGEVVVCVPWYFSRNQIQEIVEAKKRWILKKVKEYEIKKEEYVNSDSIKILGKNCNLKIRYKNIKNLNVEIESSVIKIEVPNKYKKVNSDELLKLLTQKIYNVIAEREIERAMEKIRILLGYAPDDYKLERMKNMLGRCDDNTIIINPDIVKYKEEIIDYVVLHEFIHLKNKTHSKKFYEKLKQYEPNHEKYIDVISGLQY